MLKKICIVLLLSNLLIGCTDSESSAAINKENVIKAIIGEAENQGYTGMLYVACAIRNRGTLHGVYGLSAPRLKRLEATGKIYTQAKQAWEVSKDSPICFDIQGAKYWENTKAFGVPYWAQNMKVVFTYKDHQFFK